MNDEQTDKMVIAWDVTEEQLIALISGIERVRISNLVKSSNYLKRHVFPGFRPSRLPWDQVPQRLARYAQKLPDKIKTFLTMWIESNALLLSEAATVSLETLHDDVAEMLVRNGLENKLQVFWALRLTKRAEIQQALDSGLTEEILDETSALFTHARGEVLTSTLQEIQVQNVQLRQSLADKQQALEDSTRSLQHRKEQFEQSQRQLVALKEQLEQEETQFTAQAKRLNQTEEECRGLRQQVVAQAVNTELHQSVKDLRESLEAQSRTRGLQQGSVQQQYSETLLVLEEQRRENARLRLRLDKVEQDLKSTYSKRDEEIERNEALFQELAKAERTKEVIIQQKRELTMKLEVAERQLANIRYDLQQQTITEALRTISFSELEERWWIAREEIQQFLQSAMQSIAGASAEQAEVGMWATYQRWMQIEERLAQQAFNNLNTEAYTECLVNFEKGQQLLALRWYLLEYTRQVVLVMLQGSGFPLQQ